MLRRLVMALLVLSIPSASRADDPPERLLPAATQVYLRWDGVDAHRAAYERTALGKMAAGDSGKFVLGLLGELKTNLESMLTVPQLLGGAPPERLQRIQADAREAPKLVDSIFRNGFVVGLGMSSTVPPSLQLTLVLPNAGTKPEPFLSTMRLALLLSKIEFKEVTVGERKLYHANPVGVSLAWWVEGKDAVIVASTDLPETMLQRITGNAPRLTDKPWFKKLQAFKEFETSTRAFVDGAGIVKLVRPLDARVARLLDDLGLDGLKAVTFYSGFDGPTDRSVLLVEAAGPRKGALRLAGGKPFKLSDLPVLPSDLVNFVATRLNFGDVFDVGVEVVEAVTRFDNAKDLSRIREGLKKVDTALGINLRQDLLGSLGDLFVAYSSPAEGPFMFGQTYLFKVKDARKLQSAIEQSIKALATLTGADMQLRKKQYRGVDLYEVHVRKEGFIFVPTYTIHQDWLALGYFPQSVQGYILRATGELPAWKPGPHVQAALHKLPAEFTFVAVSDPRPGIKQLLSIAPLLAGAIQSAAKDSSFEVGSLPNAHEATRHLFPNVVVGSGDGQTMRLETRTSLLLPVDFSGLDSYGFFIAAFFAFRF